MARMKKSIKHNLKEVKHTPARSIKVKYSDEPVTSFGGIALVDKLAMRLGFWTILKKLLPERSGDFSWMDIIRSAIGGLLSGSRGSITCEEVREDKTLQKLLSVAGAPSESTFWRALESLGSEKINDLMGRCLREWNRKILDRISTSKLSYHGFIPMFGDGTLLEGSRRREGTKFIPEKGNGLMLSTWFIGPFLLFQKLAGNGSGEVSGLREGLKDVLKDVVDPLKFRERLLVLLDSLHGDSPTCTRLEANSLKYIIGANKLTETDRLLKERADFEWVELDARPDLDWGECAVCVCKIQCADWSESRMLIGRRWRKKGDLPGMYNYSGVLTNLTKDDVSDLQKKGSNFAEVIWKLYDGKAGMENYYKDFLEDLSGHHPPCQELNRNRGYYSLLAFAYTLSRGVDLLGGWGDSDLAASQRRGSIIRQDGKSRKRARPKLMRLWRLRRRYFSLPGRVTRHAGTVLVQLLGVGKKIQHEFEACFRRLSRC